MEQLQESARCLQTLELTDSIACRCMLCTSRQVSPSAMSAAVLHSCCCLARALWHYRRYPWQVNDLIMCGTDRNFIREMPNTMNYVRELYQMPGMVCMHFQLHAAVQSTAPFHYIGICDMRNVCMRFTTTLHHFRQASRRLPTFLTSRRTTLLRTRGW